MIRILDVLKLSMLVLLVANLCGCVAPKYADNVPFRQAKPASVLILPPINMTVAPEGTAAVLAQATFPMAESGYYVVPVAVMEETFRQNGLHIPDEIHELPISRLRGIFGADAALYMTIKQYGSKYVVVQSMTIVELDARLVDLRTGTELWQGTETVVDSRNNNGGGLASMLIQAVVDQVANTLRDRSYTVAGRATGSLLSAGGPKSILYGPRSPHYEAAL